MTHGHLIADLDPLQMAETYKEFEEYGLKFKVPQSKLTSLVDYKNYGFTDSDLDRDFYIDAPELHGVLSKKKVWKLQELVSAYKNAYCQKIGVEFMHIPDRERCNYIRDKFELMQF